MNRLVNNWPVKILSLVLAGILWFIVISGQSRSGTFPGKIPVTFTHLQDKLVAVSDTQSTQIKIAAEPKVWTLLSLSSFTAEANLTGLTSGTHRVPIEVSSLNSSVQIVEKKPAVIIVTIEPFQTRKVPVGVRVTGQSKDGSSLISAIATPDSVDVMGPESIINSISEATATIPLDSKINGKKILIPVSAFNTHGEIISNLNFSPKEVTIQAEIGKSQIIKPVAVKIKTIGTLQPGLIIDSILVNPPLVSITGANNVLDGIRFIETQPVDLSKLTISTVLDAQLELPNNTQLVDSNNSVKITINIKPIQAQ